MYVLNMKTRIDTNMPDLVGDFRNKTSLKTQSSFCENELRKPFRRT